MAIYLKLEASSGIPDFMVWNGITELPWFWALLQNPVIAIAGGILFPMILAALLGFFYFSKPNQGCIFHYINASASHCDSNINCKSAECDRRHKRLNGFFDYFRLFIVEPSHPESDLLRHHCLPHNDLLYLSSFS